MSCPRGESIPPIFPTSWCQAWFSSAGGCEDALVPNIYDPLVSKESGSASRHTGTRVDTGQHGMRERERGAAPWGEGIGDVPHRRSGS